MFIDVPCMIRGTAVRKQREMEYNFMYIYI